MIIIHPWIGERYKEGFAGRKVLVLGESNYDPRPVEQRGDQSTIVVDNVRDCVFSKGSVAFFTKIARLLLRSTDRPLALREHLEDTWRQIAFHNFVQQVLVGARNRPTPGMWQAGKEALAEVIASLEPDVMIVVGVELSHHVRAMDPSLPTAYTRHPSSFGFMYAPAVEQIRMCFSAHQVA